MVSILEPLGAVLIIVGGIFVIVGGFMMLLEIFRISVTWGMAMFVPIVNWIAAIAFLVTHWDKAKRPFLIWLGGMPFLAMGFICSAIANGDLG